MTMSSPVLASPEEGKKRRTKLIRLRNGHYRRIVDISTTEERKLIPNICSCVCVTPRKDDSENEGKWEDLKNAKRSKEYDEKSDYMESEKKESYTVAINEDQTENLYSKTISFTSVTPTSVRSEEAESRRKQSPLDAKEEEEAEEKEETEEEIEEEEIESTDDEKEEEKKEIIPEAKKLIEPSKTLMRGTKTNIYFLSNKEMVQTLMCYNYNCNAVVFEKDTYLRYLYMKSISNIILNERMIDELCKQEDLKYVLTSNAIVLESTDFLKPLIIEFESSISKRVFVRHLKHNAKKEIDIKKYHDYLGELNNHEKIRLMKIERFHSFNKMIQSH
ncbi:Uncharacterized protein PCOAH_00007030 [Plasmodium coatneyi]|uniref:Uncharacterized protein n=1 Tax=Plasmodium coatneyi TaxID=208452 RepID=A0A1B1DU91_9APIC|nr:Uncharacterized protein PCOAH_00007030 [Plasmodium coatneyi]ANQ06366.1 Uncharacterized protein PCOAH_00007030 [Plasmodium coatneyi]